MILADVMSRSLVTIDPALRVFEADRIASSHDVKHLLVVRDGSLVGVLCKCDLAHTPEDASITHCMTKLPLTANWHDRVTDAAKRMTEENIGCLPVLAEGQLVGIVTRRDLARVGARIAAHTLVCEGCGSTEDVHVRRADNLPWCIDCLERSHPEIEIDDGGGD